MLPSDSARDKYRRAMLVKTQAEADKIFEEITTATMKANPKLSREDAEMLERSNIGYWSAQYNKEISEKIRELFKTPEKAQVPSMI